MYIFIAEKACNSENHGIYRNSTTSIQLIIGLSLLSGGVTWFLSVLRVYFILNINILKVKFYSFFFFTTLHKTNKLFVKKKKIINDNF